MNKNLFWLIALLFTLSFGFMSCAEDTTVEDPYANWDDRNGAIFGLYCGCGPCKRKFPNLMKLENG